MGRGKQGSGVELPRTGNINFFTICYLDFTDNRNVGYDHCTDSRNRRVYSFSPSKHSKRIKSVL